jgi:hypothetical protein
VGGAMPSVDSSSSVRFDTMYSRTGCIERPVARCAPIRGLAWRQTRLHTHPDDLPLTQRRATAPAAFSQA